MREPRVLDIAARVLRLAGLDRQAREALVLGHGRAPEARVIVDVAEPARGELPVEDPGLVLEQVDPRRIRRDEPARLVDDRLEDLAGLADDGDPDGDLAERLLGGDLAREVALARGEPIDETGVRDRDGGLRREGLDQLQLLVAERVLRLMCRLEHAEQARVADDRDDDDRRETQLARLLVGLGVVREPVVGEVVAADDGVAGRDGHRGHALRVLGAAERDGRGVAHRHPDGIGPQHAPDDRLHEIEAAPFGAQQPAHLPDDALEDARRVLDL